MEGESSRDVALEVEEVLGAPGVVPMCNRILVSLLFAPNLPSSLLFKAHVPWLQFYSLHNSSCSFEAIKIVKTATAL